MEWVEPFAGQVVGLDTAPLIYFIEEDPTYLEVVRPFFEAISRRDIQVVTSTVTLLEVLVQPLRLQAVALADTYREFLLQSEGVSCIPVSSSIAEEAASLRSEYNLRTPDAIQIATAMNAGASAFLTNDRRLPSLPNLRLVLLHQLRSDQQPL